MLCQQNKTDRGNKRLLEWSKTTQWNIPHWKRFTGNGWQYHDLIWLDYSQKAQCFTSKDGETLTTLWKTEWENSQQLWTMFLNMQFQFRDFTIYCQYNYHKVLWNWRNLCMQVAPLICETPLHLQLIWFNEWTLWRIIVCKHCSVWHLQMPDNELQSKASIQRDRFDWVRANLRRTNTKWKSVLGSTFQIVYGNRGPRTLWAKEGKGHPDCSQFVKKKKGSSCDGKGVC